MYTGGMKKSLYSPQESFIMADEWEIPPAQVIVEETIGEGAFGEVVKGTLKGPLSNPKIPRALKTSICIPVAVKMLKSEHTLSVQPCGLFYIQSQSSTQCLLRTRASMDLCLPRNPGLPRAHEIMKGLEPDGLHHFTGSKPFIIVQGRTQISLSKSAII